jgi:hypothetical protein
MHNWVINSSKVFSSFFDNSIQLDLKFSKSPGRICETLQTKIKTIRYLAQTTNFSILQRGSKHPLR